MSGGRGLAVPPGDQETKSDGYQLVCRISAGTLHNSRCLHAADIVLVLQAWDICSAWSDQSATRRLLSACLSCRRAALGLL